MIDFRDKKVFGKWFVFSLIFGFIFGIFGEENSIFAYYFMSFFLTPFVAICNFIPSCNSKYSGDEEQWKKNYNKMFWTRIIILIIMPYLAFLDFIFMAFSAFGKKGNSNLNVNNTLKNLNKCKNCGADLKAGNNFCENCGTKIDNYVNIASDGVAFNSNDYPLFNCSSENDMLKIIIEDELVKNNSNNKITLSAIETKKNIFTLIYSIILFICLSLLFFHMGGFIVIMAFIAFTLIYVATIKDYNIVAYLTKEIKKRPDEKFNYIISSVLSGAVNSSGFKFFRLGLIIVAVVVPLYLFKTPNIIYEKQDDAYVVRFYTIGWLKNGKVLEIPAEYKGKEVVGIRGRVFANVPTIEEVKLPDTITEIRGEAFKNAVNLKSINLPSKITEIKGNTFEDCSSLVEITIPDSVTRIGGHAFRNNSSLEKVNISGNSQLEEIGSSAFRNCGKLEEIALPYGVNVNERAFKESPTKIKRYNDDGKLLEDIYPYSDSLYVKVGVEENINEYNPDSAIFGSTITLIRVTGSNDYYKYEFRYKFNDEEITFTLGKYRRSVKVNEDLVVEAVSEYMFSSHNEGFLISLYSN